jgi:chromatin assembly factor 1 subunit A
MYFSRLIINFQEKERLEKKAAKAEKEKKAKDAQNKSRTIMANFFTKPKPQVAAGSISKAGGSCAGPSRAQNDFERTFKPFVLKKGSVLAPPNCFKAPKKRKGKEVATVNDSDIVITDTDDETEKDSDVVMNDAKTPFVDVSSMDPRGTNSSIPFFLLLLIVSANADRLRTIRSSLPPRLGCSRRKDPDLQLRMFNPYSVREFMTKLSEAEVAGDDNEVRTLLDQLQDRDLFPAKVFIYHEDARPGYFGTWTRSSKLIGSRRPFAKDVLEFDYNYDSGEEWEGEPEGDADDVLQDDDDDGGTDEADSDLDSWLVDDDEEPEAFHHDFRDLSPPMLPDFPDMPPPPPPLKRKAPEPDKKAKKRKIVVPLVPFSKGPCWETRIGKCEYEPFNQYRIQLFNGKLSTRSLVCAKQFLMQRFSRRYPIPHRSIHIHINMR